MVESSGDQDMEVVDLRFESLRDLQEGFGPYLSPEGFFLADRSDLAASDVLRFRLMLPDDFVLIEGVGVVVWVRRPEDATATAPFGAAVEFATLSDRGRELVERIVHSHVEDDGRPFDMSRPSDNGDLQAVRFVDTDVPDAPDSQDVMRFTVRENSAPGSGDPVGVGDAELRLPFEEDVRPDLDQSTDADGDQPVAEPAMSDGIDDSGDQALGAEVRETPELQEVQEDPDRRAIAVEAPEPLVPEPVPVSSEAPGALEIRLSDDRVSMADREASWEDGEAELDSSDRPKAKGRSLLVWTLVGIVVLVGAGWVVWTQYPEYLPWGGPAAADVTADVDGSNGAPVVSDAIVSLSDEDLEAAVEAAVDAMTAPEQADNSEPDPTEAPVSVDVVSGPGSKVVDIKTDAGESGTVVLIRADGSIKSRRIMTSVLPDPPRILVRIIGIDSRYRPVEVPVGTSEVRRIRIGYHPETRPPSLWIVLDRADEGVQIRDVQTSGNVVRVEVGR